LDVDVDHFDNGGSSEKFAMRYLIDQTYWDPETGPILFYAGNEGDIYSFYDNTGFMTQTIAEATKALVVFGEHRYFGVSYPFPPEVAFERENNVYLTVEQAMMDYVDLIKFIRQDYNMEDRACIVFGGSYGGMLAAWLRMKFPSVFQGALAASAPFLYFKDAPSAPEYGFGEICTEDFRTQLDKSPDLIRESWNMMMDMKTRQDTWDQLS
jgi:pimeloyl-ACP methyl ester carboxylesterase